VVNLGIPGLNSTFVANRLERQIFQLRPGLVIVWVGINNLWNAVERQAGSATDDPLRWRRPLMRSRLFRLASIAWFNATGHQYDAEGRGGWYEGELPPSGRVADGVEMPDPAPGLARDLTRMVELTRSVDTPILFVAYPMAGQRAISRVIVVSIPGTTLTKTSPNEIAIQMGVCSSRRARRRTSHKTTPIRHRLPTTASKRVASDSGAFKKSSRMRSSSDC
jgi:hypothetical protein